jgi:hypothetical protein
MAKLVIKKSVYRELMASLLRKGWVEGQHPRDGAGRFALAPDTGLNPPMGGGGDEARLKSFKTELRRKLESMAVPRMKVDYTVENFKKLFGEWNRVDTPIGRVTVPYSQFNKLKDRNREGWLGAMHQTITDPVLVIQESPEKKLLVKTFTSETKGVISFLSIVIEEGKSRVNISNHEKEMNNILNKIKKAGDVVYQKSANTGNGSLTIGKSLRGVLPAGGESSKPETHLSTASTENLKKSISYLKFKIVQWNLENAIQKLERYAQ